jgi:hypothetical protein
VIHFNNNDFSRVVIKPVRSRTLLFNWGTSTWFKSTAEEKIFIIRPVKIELFACHFNI